MEVPMCITIRRTTNLSLLLLVVVLFGTSPGWSQTFQVIYNFGGPGNPVAEASPLTAMTLDDQGNLFGTTSEGGLRYSPCPFGCGTVFELSPNGSGGWNEQVVYAVTGYGGGNPTAPLALDPLGNLYGTVTCYEDCTAFGGSI